MLRVCVYVCVLVCVCKCVHVCVCVFVCVFIELVSRLFILQVFVYNKTFLISFQLVCSDYMTMLTVNTHSISLPSIVTLNNEA